jgi:DnaJ family protein C protein 17
MAPTTDADKFVDYYELLSIPATASESEIRRAYRKTSLLYHPDKVKPTPETLDKFQLLQTAINALTDAAEKSKYDQTRAAKHRRLAETAAMDSRRRKMKEALEKGEQEHSMTGTKRTMSDRELEIKRIQEENRNILRKRREAVAAQKAQEAQTRAEAQAQEQPSDSIDRCVKVRWVKEGDGLEIDRDSLEQSFPAGDVEDVIILKDKKRRVDGRDKKVLLGTAVIVFKSVALAKKVVSKGPWEDIESVEWAAAEERDGT